MSTTPEFEGSYTVMVTPFTDDGSAVDTAALERFVDWQIAEGGVPGLIPLGSTGEFLSVTEDERRQVVETVVGRSRGRIPVVVGTADEWTPRAVAFSRDAERMGASGVMVVPPYYSSPTEDELFEHYRRIAEAISIPVMVYNNPNTSNVDLRPELIARLAEIDNISYVQGVERGHRSRGRDPPARTRAHHRVRGLPRLRFHPARREGLGVGVRQHRAAPVGRRVRPPREARGPRGGTRDVPPPAAAARRHLRRPLRLRDQGRDGDRRDAGRPATAPRDSRFRCRRPRHCAQSSPSSTVPHATSPPEAAAHRPAARHRRRNPIHPSARAVTAARPAPPSPSHRRKHP